MYASARFAAWPSVTQRAAGSISIAVTMLEPSSMHDMMIAAVASSLRVLRIRPARLMRIVVRVAAAPAASPPRRFRNRSGPAPASGKNSRHAAITASQPLPPAVLDVPIAAHAPPRYQSRHASGWAAR